MDSYLVSPTDGPLGKLLGADTSSIPEPNGPPPTISAMRANVSGGWNSIVVPSASPTARPNIDPLYLSSIVVTNLLPIEGFSAVYRD